MKTFLIIIVILALALDMFMLHGFKWLRKRKMAREFPVRNSRYWDVEKKRMYSESEYFDKGLIYAGRKIISLESSGYKDSLKKEIFCEDICVELGDPEQVLLVKYAWCMDNGGYGIGFFRPKDTDLRFGTKVTKWNSRAVTVIGDTCRNPEITPPNQTMEDNMKMR